MRQWQRWSSTTIPSLIEPYLTYRRLSRNFRDVVDYELPQCNCQSSRRLKVPFYIFLSLLSLVSGSKTVDLMVCPCVPAAVQLVRMGFFPCAPLGPTLAVSLPVLSLVRQLFMHTPLNISAWSESLEAYLGGMGYEVDTKGGIRRRFGNAYHWYCILEISLEEYIQQCLQGSAPSPSGPCPGLSSFQDPCSKKWPSEYLRKRCPLCFVNGLLIVSFASSSNIDAIVCIDACFTQKRRSGLQDDPVNPTATVFLSQEEIDSMENEVDGLRKKKPSDEEDGFEQGMRIPTSVLKNCNESFTAADEKRQKASTQFFSDTGVMALLCCHDRVIHLANMTSAGEKQHYALALIKSLFSHLPDNFHIGLLYDIGCQLEQSCRKWGFLKPFLPRISFAISVFHAFGHQWPCQLIYHPRKREGFGLSDGEGCEHFWSSIKGLIPSLRVSGFHQCLFVIDFQVHYLDGKSLTGLGQWLLRRWNHCQAKKASAIKGLRKSEWAAQVAVQTKPTPHKLITDNHYLLLTIMATQKSLENYETRLEELEKDLLHGASDMTSLNIQLSECHQKVKSFKQALQKQKATLGVNGLADLATLQSNSYLQLRMHALAIKTRIRDRLRQRKFELERLERSYRQTVSEQRLQNHTETSVKQREPGIVKLCTNYNNMCAQMAALIHQGKAPQGSIAPVLIPRDALFKLDVDDDIWQDAGLEDDTGRFPPAWLADENVRSGIRSLLELRRCEEEERRLLHERRMLMEWFSEEWSRLQRARQGSNDDLAYELDCHASALASLCLRWQTALRDFPSLHDENWGATNEELNSKMLISPLLATSSDEEESLDDLAFEDEEGLEVLDDELLCVAEEFALADEYHQQFKSCFPKGHQQMSLG
ncbi:hypothetical protein EDD15DRAFT_2384749 [Pisolithus albus]|nr:hypothetical protein EDD15DRAFT_2384749 [Pisolithus albus]